MPNATGGVPWSTIVAVSGSILGIVGTALLILMRLLLKSYQRNAEQELEAVKAEAEQNLLRFKEVTQEKLESMVSKALELDRRIGESFAVHAKLRDKWDEFLREYLEIDIGRSKKVEALFRIVDQMQATLEEIRPTLNTKIEEMIMRVIAELKLYVRDFIAEE